MAGEVTLSQYDGNYKIRYAERLSQVIPSFAVIQEDIPFEQSKRLGEKYRQAVLLRRSHGFSYHVDSDGLISLNPAIAAKISPAELTGSQITGREQITYGAAFAGEEPEIVFSKTMDLTVESLWEGGHHRLEADLLYGQDANGIAVIASVAGNVLTIVTAQWGGGIFMGCEGAQLHILDTTLATIRDGAGSDAVGTDFYTITAVDPDARTITLDDATNAVATDIIFFRGQRTASAYKVMAGLHKWLTNTGTIAGIDAGTNTLWKASTITAGSGNLSFDLILTGCARASFKGAMGDMVAYVTPFAWADMASDLAALRRLAREDQVKKVVLGAEAIEFHVGTGKVSIKAHPMVKNGFAYVIPVKEYERIGALDMSFIDPYTGKAKNEGASVYMHAIDGKNGFEIRIHSNQALYTGKPGRGFVINNIVNTAA